MQYHAPSSAHCLPLNDLAFARCIQSLSTKSKSLFGGSKKSTKGAADLQLWRRGNRFQLAVRWSDSVPDKWLTVALPSDYDDSSKERTRVSFPKLPYVCGTSLDMMNILARNSRSSGVENREGAFSIDFLTSQGESYYSPMIVSWYISNRCQGVRSRGVSVLQGRPLSTIL